MIYLLDINVISELRKGYKADPHVIAWAASVEASLLFVSVVSIEEIELGIRSLCRKDEASGNLMLHWLENILLPTFSGRILPITLDVVRISAPLHVPNPGPIRDYLIAATARAHRMTVITRDINDFERTGVNLVNPWEQ